MAKQWFRVEGVYPGVCNNRVSIPPKSFNHTGFPGCEAIQKHIAELLKEGVEENTIKVFVDSPGGPNVTEWQLTRAKSRMGRK